MNKKNQIRFDWHNALHQAEKLEETAFRIDQLVSEKMDDMIQNIHTAWKGESASLYLRKAIELQSRIQKTSDDLRRMACEIRISAKRVYDSEKRALYIVQEHQ